MRQTLAVARTEASREDVVATLQRGVLIAEGPATVFAAEALVLFDDVRDSADMLRLAERRAAFQHAAVLPENSRASAREPSVASNAHALGRDVRKKIAAAVF